MNTNQQRHHARLDALARGAGEAVTRSMMTTAERAQYDRQNAGSAQDPLKAYEIDQVTAADSAKAQAQSLRDLRSDALARAGLQIKQRAADGAALAATEMGTAANVKRAGDIAAQLFPDEPEPQSALAAILEAALMAGRGNELATLAAGHRQKIAEKVASLPEGAIFYPGAFLMELAGQEKDRDEINSVFDEMGI